MRDAHLALSLLGTANGLQAGLSRHRLPPAAAMVGLSVGFVTATPHSDLDLLLVAACALAVLSAGVCWLPARARPAALATALALVSGFVAGRVGGGSDVTGSAGFVLALALAMAVTVKLARKGWALPVLVAAGWLIAIGTLNLTLAILPVTPGYVPDHLE